MWKSRCNELVFSSLVFVRTFKKALVNLKDFPSKIHYFLTTLGEPLTDGEGKD